MGKNISWLHGNRCMSILLLLLLVVVLIVVIVLSLCFVVELILN